MNFFLDHMPKTVKLIATIAFLLFPLPSLATGGISQDSYSDILIGHNSSLPENMIDEKYNQAQIENLQNVNYSSSINFKNTELQTRFDANNLYENDEENRSDLEVNSFYIQYKNKNNGMNYKIGRQASPGGGVFGRIDGLAMKTALLPQFVAGVNLGFPVNSLNKNSIQSNKPFIALNAELTDFYKAMTIRPYVVMQKVDGFLNRQSIGSEINLPLSNGTIYQVTDYDIQFNELNKWYIEGQLRRDNTFFYHIAFDYKRNPLLGLDNALREEYRASDLKSLNSILSKRELLAQASDRSAKNYSTSIGSSFPLTSRIQFVADVNRYDQLYKVPDADGYNYLSEHNYQNEFSTQLVTSNFLKKHDSVSLELGYTDAKYFTNTSLTLRNQLPLSGLYHMDFKLRMAERESDTGELLYATLPTTTISCQCSKKLFSEFEMGYENWDYAGNTLQNDFTQLFANINFVLEL